MTFTYHNAYVTRFTDIRVVSGIKNAQPELMDEGTEFDASAEFCCPLQHVLLAIVYIPRFTNA